MDDNTGHHSNGDTAGNNDSNIAAHVDVPENPTLTSSPSTSGDNTGHANTGCPIDRSVLQHIHIDLLSMIGVVNFEIYRLQCGLARFTERQQLISRILYVDESFTELVSDGIAILDEWNQELCVALTYMENRLSELYRSLGERVELADMLVDLLQTNNRTFTFPPGGPFTVVNGVLSVSLNHFDSTICFLGSSNRNQ